jgi:hypothetical protein
MRLSSSNELCASIDAENTMSIAINTAVVRMFPHEFKLCSSQKTLT